MAVCTYYQLTKYFKNQNFLIFHFISSKGLKNIKILKNFWKVWLGTNEYHNHKNHGHHDGVSNRIDA